MWLCQFTLHWVHGHDATHTVTNGVTIVSPNTGHTGNYPQPNTNDRHISVCNLLLEKLLGKLDQSLYYEICHPNLPEVIVVEVTNNKTWQTGPAAVCGQPNNPPWAPVCEECVVSTLIIMCESSLDWCVWKPRCMVTICLWGLFWTGWQSLYFLSNFNNSGRHHFWTLPDIIVLFWILLDSISH